MYTEDEFGAQQLIKSDQCPVPFCTIKVECAEEVDCEAMVMRYERSKSKDESGSIVILIVLIVIASVMLLGILYWIFKKCLEMRREKEGCWKKKEK